MFTDTVVAVLAALVAVLGVALVGVLLLLRRIFSDPDSEQFLDGK
jgi:hypothetical protein